MSTINSVTINEFQKEVLESELPVIVDFWTDNCGPCEAMAPLLEEFSQKLEGKLKIVKFHVPIEEVIDESNEVVKKYEVMGFPTFLIFKNGELVKSEIGGMEEEYFQNFIDSAL